MGERVEVVLVPMAPQYIMTSRRSAEACHLLLYGPETGPACIDLWKLPEREGPYSYAAEHGLLLRLAEVGAEITHIDLVIDNRGGEAYTLGVSLSSGKKENLIAQFELEAPGQSLVIACRLQREGRSKWLLRHPVAEAAPQVDPTPAAELKEACRQLENQAAAFFSQRDMNDLLREYQPALISSLTRVLDICRRHKLSYDEKLETLGAELHQRQEQAQRLEAEILALQNRSEEMDAEASRLTAVLSRLNNDRETSVFAEKRRELDGLLARFDVSQRMLRDLSDSEIRSILGNNDFNHIENLISVANRSLNACRQLRIQQNSPAPANPED